MRWHLGGVIMISFLKLLFTKHVHEDAFSSVFGFARSNPYISFVQNNDNQVQCKNYEVLWQVWTNFTVTGPVH